MLIATRQIDKLIVKSADDYRSSIRSSVRGAWTGTYDYVDFLDAMFIAIDRGFTQAWEEGMRDYGMTLADANIEERGRLQQEIMSERQYVSGFADFVDNNSKKRKKKLTTAMQRAELWANAYERIRQLAKMYAARDEPMLWVVGATKEHCRDCDRLNGRVYRASLWKEHNLLPRSWRLACHGLHCLCELIPTNLPLSRGRPPTL